MRTVTSTISDVINMTWPMVFVSMVIIISIRVCYLIKKHEHVVLYKELIMLSMIIYVLMLFQVVTGQDVVNWSSNNFIPFKEIFRYKIGSRLFFKNVLGNLIMFVPFGLFTSYTLKNDYNAKLIVFLTVLASLSIECVQLTIGRVFDVDDIILNTIGGYFGYYLYKGICHFKNRAPSFCGKEWFLNIVSILILLCIVAVVW
ncbi:MAG: VanZ family protein [Bacilli bacterium]|nr:VanZ family protein [Bacilli bacterium]